MNKDAEPMKAESINGKPVVNGAIGPRDNNSIRLFLDENILSS